MLATNGDPYYSNLVSIDFLNSLGWSRKRRRKWLRRWQMLVNRERVVDLDRQQFEHGHADDDDGAPEWCETCNNMGTIDCHCGGDLCVCFNYGEMPCPDCGHL